MSSQWFQPIFIALLFVFTVSLVRSKMQKYVALLGHVILLGEVIVWARQHVALLGSEPAVLISLLISAVSVVYGIFSFTIATRLERCIALLYSAAGLMTLRSPTIGQFFVGLEILSFAALPLFVKIGSQRSVSAGLHYSLMHLIAGGLFLLAIVLRHFSGQSLSIEPVGFSANTLDSWLLIIALGINCAFPLFHSWLLAAYSEATSGSVILLSSVTTKVALFALWRLFPGEFVLIVLGTAMAVFPLLFMMFEDNLRRLLCYSIINQLGFMVAAVGLGIPLALSGALAFLVADVLFKTLLFMGAGALAYQVGVESVGRLRGMGRNAPLAGIAFAVGSFCLCALPFSSGFATKSMIISASRDQGHSIVWLLLELASISSVIYLGVRVILPLFSGSTQAEVRPLPRSIAVAILVVATGCLLIGIFPNLLLYQFLPFRVDYHPNEISHVIEQVLLLLFAGLLGRILFKIDHLRSTTRLLDVDRFYQALSSACLRINSSLMNTACHTSAKALASFCRATRHFVISIPNTFAVACLGFSSPADFIAIGFTGVSILVGLTVGLLLCIFS